MKKLILTTASLFINLVIFSQQVTVITDKENYNLNEIVEVTYLLNFEYDSIKLPEFEDFKVIDELIINRSINSAMKVSETKRIYRLRPIKRGHLVIPSPTYLIDGNKIEGKPIGIYVGATMSTIAQESTTANSVTASKDNLLDTALIKRISDIDDYLNAAGVNGGLLIAHNGRFLINKGFGIANEVSKTPITPNTVFNIGSVSKQFTGAAILKLEEQGKLKTSDPITLYLDNVPEDKKNITIHQLLTHTAGFSHDVTTNNPSAEEAMQQNLASKLKFSPGEEVSYSNAGYQLLAAIIESVSGGSYESYLNKNLWAPAGMFFTGNQLPKYNKNEFVGSYDLSGNIDTKNTNLGGEWGVSSWNVGAGGILSTLNDLYKWHEALNNNIVLSEETKKKYFTPYVPYKPTLTLAHFTYGWAIKETPLGISIEAHGGNGYNFTSFYRYIDKDLVMIYFTNERQTRSRTLDSIPSLLFGKGLPVFPKLHGSLTLPELKRLAGVYELPSGNKINLELINNVLSINAIEPEVSRLLTNFPEIEQSDLANNLQSRIENVLDKIAKDSINQIQESIDLEGTIEQEKAYWDRTFSSWIQRFGTYKGIKIIGSKYQNKFLITYAFIEFEEGSTIVEIRQNEQKKFFIGHPSFLLPRYYRLIPQSKNEFLIYNHLLQTTSKIVMNKDGMMIQNGTEVVLAKKAN